MKQVNDMGKLILEDYIKAYEETCRRERKRIKKQRRQERWELLATLLMAVLAATPWSILMAVLAAKVAGG